MKRKITTLLATVLFSGLAFAQLTPEVLYYKFDGTGTSVPNLASNPPAGTTTATLMGGLTQGGSNICRGTVIGTGVASSSDYVNTGWAPNLGTGSWSICFRTSNITASATLFYIFGDANTASFRCFTNGVAGANNWILRGAGLSDVLLNGGATVAPHFCAFVYDNTLNNVKAYLDGVLVNTVAQTAPSLTGTGPFKVVGYATNVGMPANGYLDEFRVYSRALTAAEVSQLNDPFAAGSFVTGAPASLCPGTYATLGFAWPASTVAWSNASTFDTANVNLPGTYSVTVSGACGSGTASVTIGTLETTNAISASICGNGTYTAPSGAVYSTAGTYMDTIPNAAGCDSIITITLNSVQPPTVTASAASGTVCSGSADVLTAGGALSYVWSSGGTASTETVMPTSMTTYTVTGTDANGCTNTATVMVMVNALPVVDLGADFAVCASATLDAQNAGSTYLWSDASTAQTLTVTSSGTYSVTVTDANGCSNSDAIDVTINALPVVDLGLDITQCAGTATLDAQNAGATYLWSDASTTQTINVSASGTYSVTVTDANGCSSSDAVVVTINALPTVDLGLDATACGTYLLDAQNAGSTYLWNDNSTSQMLTVTTSGTYSVTVTDANGCTNSDAVTITINQLPAVTASAASTSVCVDDANVALTGTPANGTWSGAGVTGSSFNPMTAGNGAHTLTYAFTDANGCTGTGTVVVTVSACVGIAEQLSAEGISVYPNPNNGVFTFEANTTIGDMTMTITDLSGRVVYAYEYDNVNAGFVQQISLQNEASGMYFVHVTANGFDRTMKIAVQK